MATPRGAGEKDALCPFPLKLTRGAGSSLLRQLCRARVFIGVADTGASEETPGPRSTAESRDVVGRSVTTSLAETPGGQHNPGQQPEQPEVWSRLLSPWKWTE